MQFSQQPRTVSLATRQANQSSVAHRSIETATRKRETRIRAANIRQTARDFARIAVCAVTPELPEPHYTQLTDVELENFLRRNSLTDALAEYLLAQNNRHA
jgi:hypothetical protein